MSTVTVDEALTRLGDIDRARRARGASATIATVAFGQLLFASFVYGHGRGPVQMQPSEVLLGMLAALLVSLVVAPFLVRRRRRKEAEFAGRANEGRHARRILAYGDYFVVSGEVILYDMVERFRAHGDQLELRYWDPRHEGPVLREIEAPTPLVERLARRFEAAGARGETESTSSSSSPGKANAGESAAVSSLPEPDRIQ
jgi:hypothetical protein